MKTASPLRFPGGKSLMSNLLTGILTINQLRDYAVAEPFAGGAGASLSLLYREETHEIYINDADPSIHDFWWTIVNRPGPFLEMLHSTDVCMSEWYRQRDTYRRTSHVSRLRRGFATFYLNRCNRSGIIMNGGPIGGIEQTSIWKLDARFNKPDLEARCLKVAEYGQRIHVSQMDALDFIQGHKQKKVFFFMDPPYYEKGQTLYLNKLDHSYHLKLSHLLRSMVDSAWVLTYDDCPQIDSMYADWANIRSFSLRYTASGRRLGKELFITPKWLQLPEKQSSAAIGW